MYVRTSRYRLTPEGLADLKSGIREQMMGPITAAPGNRLFAVMTSPDDEQNGLFVSAWESKEDCDHFESEVRPTLYARWKGGFDGPFEVNYWETRWPGTLQINENSLANPARLCTSGPAVSSSTRGRWKRWPGTTGKRSWPP